MTLLQVNRIVENDDSRLDRTIESAVFRLQEESNKLVEILKARKKARQEGKKYPLVDDSDLTWVNHYSSEVKEIAKEIKVREQLKRDLEVES